MWWSIGRLQLISDYGVVGQRWPQNDRDDFGYYNHMPAAEIRQRCPQFDDYTRLTVVRDPYDRAISYFHFSHPTFTPPGGMPLDQAIALLKQGDRQVLQERFVAFLRHGLPDEQALLCIEGRLAVQRWIRFEALHQDLEQLVGDLGLPCKGLWRMLCLASNATARVVRIVQPLTTTSVQMRWS